MSIVSGTLIKMIAFVASTTIKGFTQLTVKEDYLTMPMSMPKGEMSYSQPDSDLSRTSSRDYGAYGNSGDSSNQYYAPYAGYQSYGPQSSTYSNQFNPSDYYYSIQPHEKKPSLPSPTYPTFYASGYGGSIECNEQLIGGVMNEVLANTAGFGLLKPIVAAMTAGIFTKIPIILAIKALIAKLILVPLGFIILSLPIILPILLLFTPLWSKIKETFVGSTTPASPAMMVMMPATAANNTATKGRTIEYGRDIFMAVMESDSCFEKLACSLGSRDANTPFIQPILWLLKFLQSTKFVRKNIQIRNTMKRYRDAYLQGVMATTKFISETNLTAKNTEEFCNDQLYLCNTSTLYSKPGFVRFSRYL